MLETLDLLGQGFLDCLTLVNIFCAIVGCLLGSLIGVLPGLGISGTVATLLPITVSNRQKNRHRPGNTQSRKHAN